MVIFEFMSANHTVTQSAFAEPCKALAGGMDSGFMSNPNNSVVPAPQMAMQVTVATPICKSKNLYNLPSQLTNFRVLLQAKDWQPLW